MRECVIKEHFFISCQKIRDEECERNIKKQHDSHHKRVSILQKRKINIRQRNMKRKVYTDGEKGEKGHKKKSQIHKEISPFAYEVLGGNHVSPL